jgi:plasmid stability protein
MPNVVIRNLPEEVHAALVHRAQVAGQSLQQYLSAELRRIGTTPTVEEVMARIATRRGGRVGLRRATRDLAAERARR